MTLTKRVSKLGAAVHARAAAVILPRPFDEADWLAQFELWGTNGCLDHEPDFPTALALLREELVKAQASIDPPFDPPADFHLHEPPHIREENWRSKYRFPALCEALGWLQEMRLRVEFGVPRVSEAEYRELEAWFLAHEHQLDEISKAEDGLRISTRKVWCWQVRYGLRDGPRGEGSGRTAEEMRQLRAGYGGRVTPTLAGVLTAGGAS